MNETKLLGLMLRAQRKRLLLTQSELAEKAGISLQHVGDIERGDGNPTFSCLCRLAEVMGVRVSNFFIQQDEDPSDISEMKTKLIDFIKTAKKRQIDVLFIVYKGLL